MISLIQLEGKLQEGKHFVLFTGIYPVPKRVPGTWLCSNIIIKWMVEHISKRSSWYLNNKQKIRSNRDIVLHKYDGKYMTSFSLNY